MTQPPDNRPSADTRKHLRAPMIVYRLRFDDGQRTFFGYSKNISRSGMFIATVNPREPGSLFKVEIPLPPPLNRTVTCTCEVVWTRQYSPRSPLEPGMGMKFNDLPEEVAAAIDSWAKGQEA